MADVVLDNGEITGVHRLRRDFDLHRQESEMRGKAVDSRLGELAAAVRDVHRLRVWIQVLAAIVVVALPLASIAIPWVIARSVESALITNGVLKP